MNRYLLILAVFAAVAVSAYAAAPLSTNSSPQSAPMAGWDDVAQAFRAILVGSDGSVTTTSNVGGSAVSSSNPIPAYDARGRVATGTPYSAELSTSTPKLLSAIASWSAGDILVIQCNNVAFYTSLATTTAATVFKGKRAGQWDIVTIIPNANSASWDMTWMASTMAAASISVDAYPLVP